MWRGNTNETCISCFLPMYGSQSFPFVYLDLLANTAPPPKSVLKLALFCPVPVSWPFSPPPLKKKKDATLPPFLLQEYSQHNRLALCLGC